MKTTKLLIEVVMSGDEVWAASTFRIHTDLRGMVRDYMEGVGNGNIVESVTILEPAAKTD